MVWYARRLVEDKISQVKAQKEEFQEFIIDFSFVGQREFIVSSKVWAQVSDWVTVLKGREQDVRRAANRLRPVLHLEGWI